MTSFGWKRKIGHDVGDRVSKVFLTEESSVDNGLGDERVDWLANANTSRVLLLESTSVKCDRLKDEGCVLAKAERFWEALRRWDEALRFNPNDCKLYEMKAQAFMSLHEVFPAIQAAEMVVKLNPTWWVGYQTLGRTQLGLGEVKLALRSFCRAFHLQPDERDIWDEDIQWAKRLLIEQERISQEEKDREKETKTPIIEELDSHTPEGSDGSVISNQLQKMMAEFQESRAKQYSKNKFNTNKSWVKLRS